MSYVWDIPSMDVISTSYTKVCDMSKTSHTQNLYEFLTPFYTRQKLNVNQYIHDIYLVYVVASLVCLPNWYWAPRLTPGVRLADTDITLLNFANSNSKLKFIWGCGRSTMFCCWYCCLNAPFIRITRCWHCGSSLYCCGTSWLQVTSLSSSTNWTNANLTDLSNRLCDSSCSLRSVFSGISARLIFKTTSGV